MSSMKNSKSAIKDYKAAWELLKSWLETDCDHGASHKSKRALLLMQEIESGTHKV